MIRVSVAALVVASLLFDAAAASTGRASQSAQACQGKCQDGYLSVCVQRGSDCSCTCVKAVSDGARIVRDALRKLQVPDARIEGAVKRYESEASTRERFSFDVNEDIKISGTGHKQDKADR